MDCHYVTRSITKPWEHKSGNFKYFDFAPGRIRKGKAQNLFATQVTNPLKIEVWLSKFIEQPLGTFREKIRDNTEYLSYREKRAVVLYFLLQPGRLIQAGLSSIVTPSGENLTDLLDIGSIHLKDESYFDELTKFFSRFLEIATVRVRKGEFLYFPGTGFYGVPLIDDITGPTTTSALPVSPSVAVVLVPKGFSFSHIESLQLFLHVYSVGLHATRILIPKDVYEQANEIEIRESILIKRQTIMKNGSDFANMRELWNSAIDAF